jgi:hypothetical protein
MEIVTFFFNAFCSSYTIICIKYKDVNLILIIIRSHCVILLGPSYQHAPFHRHSASNHLPPIVMLHYSPYFNVSYFNANKHSFCLNLRESVINFYFLFYLYFYCHFYNYIIIQPCFQLAIMCQVVSPIAIDIAIFKKNHQPILLTYVYKSHLISFCKKYI